MSEPTYKQPGDEYFQREVGRLTAENERLRGELNAAATAISRWLAHQWGPQEQYAKMREARDTAKHALEQGELK